jgi:hypothetical protein
MNELLYVDLHDDELMAEIRLVADLMIASAASPGCLDQETIDGLLGVDPEPPAGIPVQRQ